MTNVTPHRPPTETPQLPPPPAGHTPQGHPGTPLHDTADRFRWGGPGGSGVAASRGVGPGGWGRGGGVPGAGAGGIPDPDP